MDEIPDMGITRRQSAAERALAARALELFRGCPIPDPEILANLGLFKSRQQMARELFFSEVYRQIVTVHGSIMEFGVRWGRDLVLMQGLRGLLEPYNYTRRIIGFDTFQGFPSVHAHDGEGGSRSGDYTVTEDYDEYLLRLLALREHESPLAHIVKHELIRGDVTETLPAYLADHPETIVAFAYLDLDLYEPTRACLEALRPFMPRGAIIGFDELNSPDFPGETVALRETWGLEGVRLVRSPIATYPCYFVVD